MAEARFRAIVDAVCEAADHALELWAGGATQVGRREEAGQASFYRPFGALRRARVAFHAAMTR